MKYICLGYSSGKIRRDDEDEERNVRRMFEYNDICANGHLLRSTSSTAETVDPVLERRQVATTHGPSGNKEQSRHSNP